MLNLHVSITLTAENERQVQLPREAARRHIDEAIRATLRPELLNRIDRLRVVVLFALSCFVCLFFPAIAFAN